MRYSNILLVLDADEGSAPALSRAVALARRDSAALTICKVVDSIPSNYLRIVTAITPREILDAFVADERDRLIRFVQAVDTEGLSIDIEVLAGKFHIEIARMVRRRGLDLVIKSVAGRRAMRARSVQRNDRALIRTCPCPVWLVNVADVGNVGGILAALEMPSPGEENDRLNEHIVQVARSIALAEFRPLHIVHAWNLAGERHLRARGNAASDIEVDRMVAQEAARRKAWLRNAAGVARSDSDRIAARYIAPELHVVKGNVSQVLPALADKLGAGLIVMGSAARSGISGFLVGNTSETMLPRSDCSFLIVKEPVSSAPPVSPRQSRPVENADSAPRWPHYSTVQRGPSNATQPETREIA